MRNTTDPCYKGQITKDLTLDRKKDISLMEIEGSELVDQIEVPIMKKVGTASDDADETEQEMIEMTDEGVVKAKKDIDMAKVISYFAGEVIKVNRSLEEQPFWNNWMPIYEPNQVHYYNINEWIGDHKFRQFSKVVHVPPKAKAKARPSSTLGHKIKHSFSHWNCVFVSTHHPRYGLVPTALTVEKIEKGQEILCHHNLPFHMASQQYQERWRAEIDGDWVDGPLGHRRRGRRPQGQRITSFLTDQDLHTEFVSYAVNVLGLSQYS